MPSLFLVPWMKTDKSGPLSQNIFIESQNIFEFHE